MKDSARRAVAALLLAGFAAGAPAQTASHRPDALLAHGFENAAQGPRRDADAARFLAQATFGPSTEAIAQLRAQGYENWLQQQFAAPIARSEPYLDWVGRPPANNDVTDDARLEIWAINSVGLPDPSRGMAVPTDALRQRVAYALSQIFVVSNVNGTLNYQPWALASYQDMLAEHAFGNFSDLLHAVTLHPAMGIYLSMIQNQKADEEQNIHPDENFAREVLQLFSVGLVMLDSDGSPVLQNGAPIPTYNQNTVRGFAAVFTGWNWNNTGCGEETFTCCDEETYFWCGPSNRDEPPWQLPMQPVEAYHDNTSPKQLLNYSGVALANGVLPPAGAQAELDAALDNIFRHPNVGPFLARRLIQNLVTSNPSPAYIRRVAQAFADNGQGVRGDMKAVIRAVLLDVEARYGQWQQPERFGKLREPLLKFTHLWRAMEARSGDGRIGNLSTWPYLEERIGQAPLRSPTVFNFFKPDYSRPGEIRSAGLRSPEFQILSDSLAVGTPNRLFYEVFCYYTGSDRCWDSDAPDTLQLNLARDAPLAASDPGALLDRYSLLFLSGQMSPFMRATLLAQLQQLTQQDYGNSLGRVRVQNALYLILNSPEYSIQK
ncbi:DUF1800 domain-containing protein [Tahibacter harae]|uniref:DUF1800 domain-containing protein n=1 Tax=Tahibacter harae TaxID=2963937 RepID=A0ABT1QRX3_9GAMM|nr:DUF1800 family protein [Tahibacter harae]MCQ4165045.1 DUF1800 domain-containing protein [Tahibacter harae]